jgi:hypothetical protein
VTSGRGKAAWALEGFDRETELLAEFVWLPACISDAEVTGALGDPALPKCGGFPVTPALKNIIDREAVERVRWDDYDFFVEWVQSD